MVALPVLNLRDSDDADATATAAAAANANANAAAAADAAAAVPTLDYVTPPHESKQRNHRKESNGVPSTCPMLEDATCQPAGRLVVPWGPVDK